MNLSSLFFIWSYRGRCGSIKCFSFGRFRNSVISKFLIRSGMSEALSRSVGTSIGKTFSLNSRSALNSFFSLHMCSVIQVKIIFIFVICIRYTILFSRGPKTLELEKTVPAYTPQNVYMLL